VLSSVLIVVAACGGDDDDEGEASDPTASATPIRSVIEETIFVTPTPDLGPAPGENIQGDRRLYIALGDSLSEGIGATDPKRTAWVPLVAKRLEPKFELLNLGIAGHDSDELINEGPLDEALAAIEERADDNVPENEVELITLEIGGNDLLDIYSDYVIPGTCPTVVESLQRPECVEALQTALDNYRPNLALILEQLQAAAPGIPIYVMTLYNPFSGGADNLDQIGALALEGQEGTPFAEGLNDIIRAEAIAHPGILLIEWYDLFLEKQREYISQDLIHPNDTGYQVMANELLEILGLLDE
jgi:lysophospholipase L1-like esterase